MPCAVCAGAEIIELPPGSSTQTVLPQHLFFHSICFFTALAFSQYLLFLSTYFFPALAFSGILKKKKKTACIWQGTYCGVLPDTGGLHYPHYLSLHSSRVSFASGRTFRRIKRDKRVKKLHQPLLVSNRFAPFLPWHFLYFFPEPQGQGSLG